MSAFQPTHVPQLSPLSARRYRHRTLRLRETQHLSHRPAMTLRVLTSRSPPRPEHEYRLLTSPRRVGSSMLSFVASVFFVAGVLLGGTWTSLVPPPNAPHDTSLDTTATASETGLDPRNGDSTKLSDATTPLSIAWLMTFPSKSHEASELRLTVSS